MRKWTITVFSGVLLVAGCYYLLLEHSRSIDRAIFVSSINALLNVRAEIRKGGGIEDTRYTNDVSPCERSVRIGNVSYVCDLAAVAPTLEKYGTLLSATNGVIIWMDASGDSMVVRSNDKTLARPSWYTRKKAQSNQTVEATADPPSS
jgi:hypothetical protein